MIEIYKPGTILTLKEPKSTEEKPFPYDRVKVVAQSPQAHQMPVGAEWGGGSSQGVIIQPLTDFEANLDEPFLKLQKLYDVESIPDNIVVEQVVRRVDATTSEAGRTPEEVFREEASVPDVPAPKPARRRPSPLAD